MAVNYAEKYAPIIDEEMSKESLTDNLCIKAGC